MAKVIRIILLILINLLCIPCGLSQAYIAQEKAACEDSLVRAFKELYAERDDQQRISKSDALQAYFSTLLRSPDFYYYPFDSLTWAGRIISPDRKIRVITWNVPLSDGTHRYYGFIQHTAKKKVRSLDLFTLRDSIQPGKDPEKAVYSPENWPGALYYEILVNNYKGQVYYTLLGLDFNDRFSNKKIIEVLYIDRDMHAHFGKPMFESEEKGLLNRVIFEFTSQAVMTLRWDTRLKMIVFDHLSPIEPGLEGVYKFYGPDESYDGYKFRNGIWKYYPEVEVRNE
jgi:hypothetical protein